MSSENQVLAHAQALWREGHYEQARRVVAEAVAAGTPGRRLRMATWAYGDVFTHPIAGRKVQLVRRSPADIAMVRAAWQDRAFMAQFHRLAAPLPSDDAALAGVLARESQATLLESRHLHWTIQKKSGESVGLLSMVDISLPHARAEFIVGVRNDTPGLALEASLLGLEFAFSTMRLSKICSSVYGQNDYALRSTLHLGFQREGTLRDHLRDALNGQAVSIHLSALFKDDFLSTANQRLAQRLLGRPLSVAAPS